MSEFKQIVKDGAQKVGKGVKKIFRWALVILVLGVAGYLAFCNYFIVSEGSRTGYLTKISRKGYVFKTFEGELNVGGVQHESSAGLDGNIWAFSVWDRDIFELLKESQGERITLHYREKFKAMPWQGDTDYFISKLEMVEKE